MKALIKIIFVFILLIGGKSFAQGYIADMPPPTHEIGYGEVALKLLTDSEATVLKGKIKEVEKKAGIRIGIKSLQSATIKEMGEKTLGGYALHYAYITGINKLQYITVFFDEELGNAYVFSNNKNLKEQADKIQSVFKENFSDGAGKAIFSMLNKIEEIMAGQPGKG